MDFSVFVFLSVVLFAFGYMVGNARRFGFWKMLLMVIVLIPFVIQFNIGKPHLLTMLVAFIAGYFLPYAYLLEGFGESLSDFINAICYRDAYEDIKRKEEEVEELRRQWEQANNKQRQEQQQRNNQQREQQENTHSSGQQKEQKRRSSSQSSGNTSTKSRYLAILGLDPHGEYSYQEIKKAYRRQAAKYHPDKHQGKSAEVLKMMTKKFQEVQEAYEWLGVN